MAVSNDNWNPEQYPLTMRNLQQMIQNQAVYYETLVAARKNTPREKEEETRFLSMLAAEFRNFDFKVGKIFYDQPEQSE